MGRPAWESGTIQDVTLQKHSEFALGRNEERFRQMLMHSPGAHLLHVDGIITFVNAAFCRLTGAAGPAQWLGRSVLDVTHPESHRFLGRPKGRADKAPGPQSSKIKFMRVDGTLLDVEVSHMELDLPGRREIQLAASGTQASPRTAGVSKRRIRRVLPAA